MGISGCTSCQLGGTEALKAYDRAYQLKLNEEAKQQAAQIQKPNEGINQPEIGAIVGGSINLKI
ncbi:hypothetical protein NT239_07395 [Chitinibacter sp. SCUT-21]|uniref:hypothetical protein n=1 Tax=Chitinibacter sp. SCUT-21 TaxID=2970891 RepID=UPI0035A629FB